MQKLLSIIISGILIITSMPKRPGYAGEGVFLAPPGINESAFFNEVSGVMKEILSSAVAGIAKPKSGYRIVDIGSTARGTDFGKTDYDFVLFFKDTHDVEKFWDKKQGILDLLISELQKKGFVFKNYRSGRRNKSGNLITVFLIDGDGEEVHLQVTVGIDKKVYADYYQEQMEQIKKLGGDTESIREDIIRMKKLFKDVLHCYKQEHGGMDGIGIEQLIIQSAGADDYGRSLKGAGSFDSAMRWIFRMGFDKISRHIKSFDETAAKNAIFDPESGDNLLSRLNPMAWRRIVNAARKYVNQKDVITSDEYLSKLNYTLEDALAYREDSNYAIAVMVPARYSVFIPRFKELGNELKRRGLISSFSKEDAEIIDKHIFYLFFNTHNSRQVKEYLEKQELQILSETNEKTAQESESEPAVKKAAHKKVKTVKIFKGFSILVEKRIFDEFDIRERDLTETLINAIGATEFSGIYYEARKPFIRKLKKFSSRMGEIAVIYSDKDAALFPFATKEGVITVSPVIKKLPERMQLKILAISILKQCADITGPVKARLNVKLPKLIDLIYPILKRPFEHDYFVSVEFLEMFFELKKYLPKDDDFIRTFRHMIKQKHRIHSYVLQESNEDIVKRARWAYIHSFGSNDDIKKAFEEAVTLLRDIISPEFESKYYRSKELYAVVIKAALPALTAYNSLYSEAYAATERIILTMGYRDKDYYSEQRIKDLKEYDFDAVLALVDIDNEMDIKKIESIITHLSKVHYNTIDTQGIELIRRIAVKNKRKVMEALFGMMFSKGASNIPEILASVAGEDIFDDVMQKYQQAEKDEKKLDLKGENSLRFYAYKHKLLQTLMYIGGEKAKNFFVQRTSEKPAWDTSYGDFADFILIQLQQGNFDILTSVDKNQYTVLFEGIEKISRKVQSGDYADDQERKKLEGMRWLYLHNIGEINFACLDADIFKKNYSPELEHALFEKFNVGEFKNIKDIRLRDYYASQLLEFLDAVKTDMALKKILCAFCVLSGQDAGSLSEENEKVWIDYKQYAKVLCGMGDMLAEAAERTSEKELAAQYLVRAEKAHVMAMDNFNKEIFKLVEYTIRENDMYKNFLIEAVKKEDVSALRILLTDKAMVKDLLAEGRIHPNCAMMVQSFCMNNLNNIISTYSDMARQLRQFLINGYFTSLNSKLENKKIKSITFSNIKTFLNTMGITAPDNEVIRIIENSGFSLYGLNGIIIPNLSILDSGYRGTREIDHSDARFTTRAVTVALMHYGWKGGEFATRNTSNGHDGNEAAKGNTVIQEIDYHLAPEEYRIDYAVALCVESLKPIPKHAHKRIVFIGKKPAANIVLELINLQNIEHTAKQKILEAVDTIIKLKAGEELLFDEYIKEMKDGLKILHYKDGFAGLTEEYYKHVYTPLEELLSHIAFDNRGAFADTYTIKFLDSEFSKKLSFPYLPVSSLTDREPAAVISYIQKIFFEGKDYAPAVKYLHELSFSSKLKLAKSEIFKKFLKKLITQGLKPGNFIRLTNALEILCSIGLLTADIMPGLDEIDELYWNRDIVLLREPKDRIFALAQSIEQDIKQGNIDQINPSLVYLMPFISIIDSFVSRKLDLMLKESINPFLIAEKFGFSSEQLALLKTALELEKNLSKNFNMSFKNSYPHAEEQIRTIVNAYISRVSLPSCAHLNDYDLRTAITMAVYLYFKNALIEEEVVDFPGWHNVLNSVDRWETEVLPISLKIIHQKKELEKQKELLSYKHLEYDEEQKQEEMLEKRLEAMYEKLKESMILPEVSEEIHQLEMAGKRAQQETSGKRLADITQKIEQLKIFNGKIICFYNTREFCAQLKSLLLQRLLMRDMIYFLKSFAQISSISGTSLKRRKIKNSAKSWEDTVYVKHLGQEQVTVDKTFYSQWEKRKVYYIGGNMFFNVEESYREENIVISENLGENTALCLKGCESKSGKEELFFVSSVPGNELRDFGMILQKARKKKFEDMKIFVSGVSKNISRDFQEAVLSAGLAGAEMRIRDADASIAFDGDKIIAVNSPNFRKHFLAKKEKELCLTWDTIAGTVNIRHNTRVIVEVETSH